MYTVSGMGEVIQQHWGIAVGEGTTYIQLYIVVYFSFIVPGNRPPRKVVTFPGAINDRGDVR